MQAKKVSHTTENIRRLTKTVQS